MDIVMKRTSNKFIVGFTIFGISTLYFYSALDNFRFGNGKYILMAIVLGYLLVSKKNIKKFTKEITLNLLLLLILFFIYPLITFTRNYDIQIVYYSLLSLVFVIFVYFSSVFLVECKVVVSFFYTLYITLFLLLVIQYLQTGGVLINFNNILNIFNTTIRQREYYGFIHPNSAGNICFLFLVLSFYVRVYLIENKTISFLTLVPDILVFFLMLNTGSRGATTSIFIFYIFYLFYSFRNQLTKYIRLIFTSVLILFFISFFILIINRLDENDLTALSSNRYINWIQTIKFLDVNGLLVWGAGYVNPSYFYNSSLYFLSSDNWFIYVIITLGIIGLLIGCLIIIINLFYILCGESPHISKKYILSLTVAFLYYSTVENLYFNPSNLSSLYYWITMFLFLNTYQRKKVKKFI